MALYGGIAEKDVWQNLKPTFAAATGTVVHTISSNRDLKITDLVLTNESTSNDAIFRLTYGTSASPSNDDIFRVIIPKGETKEVENLKKPPSVPYGSGNKVFARYTGASNSKVSVTMLGYEYGG